MALRSGLAAQVGYKTETTWGTAVTVDRFIPAMASNLTPNLEIDDVVSESIWVGKLVASTADITQGNQIAKPSVGHEVFDRSIGLLLKHMFGGVVTAGAGPYTHTFTPADMYGLGLTVQMGIPDVGGTVRPFTYAGAKVTGWEIKVAVGEVATMGIDFIAKSQATATALATASFASGMVPHRFTGTAVTIGGSAANVKGISLKGDTKMEARNFLGTTSSAEPIETDQWEFTGELDMEFESLTNYALFTAATDTAVVATMTTGSNTLVFTTNARFMQTAPEVSRGPTQLKLPFRCIRSSTTGADSTAITAILTNSDSTP
jgi:hypothetical protein